MTQHKFRTRKSSWSEIYLIGKERERQLQSGISKGIDVICLIIGKR